MPDPDLAARIHPDDCGPPSSRPSRYFVYRTLTGLVLLVILGQLLKPVYLDLDARYYGPYTRLFNRRCWRIAEGAHLVGRPELDVAATLGPPTSYVEWIDYHGIRTRIYRYAPSATLAGRFEVECRDGLVRQFHSMTD